MTRRTRRRFVRTFALALTSGLAAGFVLVAAGMPVVAQQQEQATPQGVGVLDFARLQANSRFVASLQERLDGENDRLVQSVQQAAQELEREQEDVRLLAPDSDQRRQREREIGEKQALLQFRQQAAQAESSVSRNRANIEFYNAAREATARVARERNLSAVFRKAQAQIPEDLSQLVRAPSEAVGNLLNSQLAVYHDASVDVTDDVVRALDARAAE